MEINVWIRSQWQRFWDWWNVRKVALLLLFAGILSGAGGSFYARNTFLDLISDIYANVGTELISIAITVLIIDALYQRRARRGELERLIREMHSRYPEVANTAVAHLRAHGWLTDGSLQSAKLWKANLEGADLVKANLEGAALAKANLQGAHLADANLQGAFLIGANLEGADLVKANLQGAHLADANLQGAFLIDANLEGADLANANLQGANLWNANLQGANLQRAKLQGADLLNVILEGADLRRANLDHSFRWSIGQLARAVRLEGATLPYSAKYESDSELARKIRRLRGELAAAADTSDNED